MATNSCLCTASILWRCHSLEERVDELRSRDLKIGRNVREDRAERADPKRIVAWDREVVLRALEAGREPHVTAGLAGRLVSVATKEGGELRAREISREPQTGITTSRTRCSRMI